MRPRERLGLITCLLALEPQQGAEALGTEPVCRVGGGLKKILQGHQERGALLRRGRQQRHHNSSVRFCGTGQSSAGRSMTQVSGSRAQ